MEPSLGTEKFLNSEDLYQDTLKIFDICNGCRRCFNLCPSFDFLFKNLDNKDGEVQEFQSSDMNHTVDLCYYCKLCYNHCPYTPPHRFNLDFPLLMMRSKVVRYKESAPPLRDRLLADTDRMGKWGTRFSSISNRMIEIPFFRNMLHYIFGIHKEKILPKYSSTTFANWYSTQKQSPTKEIKKDGRSVALFSTCYVNYNQPKIGQATVDVLEKNGITVTHPRQNCCGMPYFDTGDLKSIQLKAQQNIASLKEAIRQGNDIVAPMPTCSLMLKKEYPALFPGEDARLVATHTFDICEYLMKLHAEGKLNTEFQRNPGNIFYQIPCHLRDQNMGYKSRDLMILTGATVKLMERCSGHDGTWSVKKEYFDLSLKIGDRLFNEIQDKTPDLVATDCPLSGLHIQQGTGQTTLHPVEVLQMAYGLPTSKEK